MSQKDCNGIVVGILFSKRNSFYKLLLDRGVEKFERRDAKELLMLSLSFFVASKTFVPIISHVEARHSSLIDENWILGHSV